MNAAAALGDGFARIPELVDEALEGMRREQLTRRVDADANTIALLVWHVARVEDAEVARVAGRQELYTSDGWAARFNLRLPDEATGYGMSPADVSRVDAPPDLLRDYVAAATRATLDYVGTLQDGDLDRVVDASFTPPVTLGVRLSSILIDCMIHAGQAQLLRGIIQRTG